MKFPWFKRIGSIFVPVTFMGWIIVLIALFCSVYEFIHIDSKSHSASDTLMNFAFILCIIFIVYSGVAFLTSDIMKRNR